MTTILVLTTEVAQLMDDFELGDDGIPEQYIEYDLNEWDDYAIEAAVQCAEATEDIEVVSATIGPQRSEETIRMALAKGVDRAVRVWDDALDDVELLDVAAKTRLISAIVDDVDPDMVLSGVQSGDDSFAATGVSVAAANGFQWAAVVNDLEIDWAAGTAAVRRELEGGLEEITTVDLPAVFTIQTGINEPRYASLRGIRQAQRKPLEIRDLDDLGVDASDVAGALSLVDLSEPESESDVTLFEGETEDVALELAGALRDKGVGAE